MTESPAPIALIVVHGMGQQIPYGALDDAYRLLKKEAKRRGGDVYLERETHFTHANEPVSCAELLIRLPGESRRVHLYEAYWAPLTEGRISTWETLQFLVGSAMRCAWETLRRGFRRFIFDRPCAFKVRTTTLIALTMASLTLVALTAFDLLFLGVLLSTVLTGAEPRWLSPALRGGYIHDFTSVLAVLVTTAVVSIGIPLGLAWARRFPRARPALFLYSTFGDWVARFAALFVVVLGLRLVLRSLIEAAPGLGRVLGGVFQFLEFAMPPVWLLQIGPFHLPELPNWSRAGILLIGLSVLAFTMVLRWFMRNYLGDVAIYVSSHKVNRFYEARREIKNAAAAIGEFVYGRPGTTTRWMYGEVVVMGHSLGSVIAYDLLNRLIGQDRESAGRDAATRTRALITYGSPLDKTAFVFRAQQNKVPLVREAMAASVQPLISDPATRGLHWINLYSRFDWIGGSLDYYDLPERGPGRTCEQSSGQGPLVRPVLNLVDDAALTPILAHGEHDKGTMLSEVLMDAVFSRLDRNRCVRVVSAKHPPYTVLTEVAGESATA